MKKIFTVLCALLLVPTLALCDEIESIRNAVQSGLYDTEKINHAPIYIPDVSEINVIRAEKYEANPEIVQKYENAGMIAIEKMKMATLLYMGDEYDQKYGVDSSLFSEYHINYAWRLDDEELADIHAKNQPISAGEVVNKVKNMIRELYDESISIELKRIEVVSSFQKGKMVSDKMTSLGDYEFGDLTGIGGYGIEAYPTLDGVPIIASAGSGYLEGGAEKIYDVLYFAHPSAYVFYYSDDYMNISMMNAYKTKEVVFENVPLCGFDKVYEIVEKYVDEGKIKRVYNISLGYIIYLDKKEEYSDKKEKNGKQRDYADYLLIPTWIIGCSYSENGSNDDQTDMNSYDGSEQQDLNYQKIFIDAQTGKLHDPKEVGSERYYADVN